MISPCPLEANARELELLPRLPCWSSRRRAACRVASEASRPSRERRREPQRTAAAPRKSGGTGSPALAGARVAARKTTSNENAPYRAQRTFCTNYFYWDFLHRCGTTENIQRTQLTVTNTHQRDFPVRATLHNDTTARCVNVIKLNRKI